MMKSFPNNASPNYFVGDKAHFAFGRDFWTVMYRVVILIFVGMIAICWWIEGMDIPHKVQTSYVIHKYDPATDKMLGKEIRDAVNGHANKYVHKKRK